MEEDLSRFSPLFGVRRILFFLRLFFGFPLKSKNEIVNEFVFLPCFECIRHSFYMSCVLLATGYLIYSEKKYGIETLADSEISGYSFLEAIVFASMPWVNVISNICYLVSFKTIDRSLSEICINSTHLNKQLYELSNKIMPKEYVRKQNTHKTLLVVELFIGFLVCIPVCVSGYLPLHDNDCTYYQKFLYMISYVTFTFSWIQPSIALSADFTICCILEEINHAYLKWNILLTVGREHKRKQKDPEIKANNEDNIGCTQQEFDIATR